MSENTLAPPNGSISPRRGAITRVWRRSPRTWGNPEKRSTQNYGEARTAKSWTGTSALSMTRNWRSAVSRLTSDAEESPSRRAPDTEELKRRYNAMGKRKEIKFMCRDGRTFEGRQDGVLFWIRENQILRRRGLPCYYVAANDTKGKGRTVFTGDHEHFTLEGAKELCQQIMAGEANLGERKARYAAEDAEKERRAVAEATEQAKNFRGRLEAAGISFGKLLELEDALDDLSFMARNILLGWENGEGFPHE